MTRDPAAVDQFLGAVGTTFRLSRLYPLSHPAPLHAMAQVSAAIPGLIALGTVECKIGVQGLHWEGRHLAPRSAQVAELAGLLYARGLRTIQFGPGLTTDHVEALFRVARGTLPPDDPALGEIALGGRRSVRVSQVLPAGLGSAAAPLETPPARVSAVFHPDSVPPAIEARRAIAALGAEPGSATALARLQAVAAALVAQRSCS